MARSTMTSVKQENATFIINELIEQGRSTQSLDDRWRAAPGHPNN
jgi:hypothetical protein